MSDRDLGGIHDGWRRGWRQAWKSRRRDRGITRDRQGLTDPQGVEVRSDDGLILDEEARPVGSNTTFSKGNPSQRVAGSDDVGGVKSRDDGPPANVGEGGFRDV